MHGGYQHPPGYAGAKRGPGTGSHYRITAQGPGVTPDIQWQGAGFHPYNPNNSTDTTYKQQIDSIYQQVIGNDPNCHT
jgi:hypothetical protein